MNILIITDKYYPKPLANAICAQSVAESLYKKGHTVHMLAYKNTGIEDISPNKNIKLFSIKPDCRLRLKYFSENFPESRFNKLASVSYVTMNRVKQILNYPFIPMYSYYFPKKLFKKITDLNVKYKYDIVVSTYLPFENALSSMWFKQKHKEIKWILYTVDSFINDRHKFLNKKGNTNNYWLPKFLDACDLFIYMRSRENEYSSEYFNKWRKKMKPSDIPLLTKITVFENYKPNEVEQWVYAGSLGSPHYFTDDLIKIFLNINDNKKRVLNFYSSGEHLEKLRKIEKETNGKIKCFNYVSHSELIEIYKKSDVLVSLKYSDQISAKIFEYMTYNKKIVHISGTQYDPDVKYLYKYPNGIIIEPYKNSIEKCINKLTNELYKEKVGTIDFSFFDMNRPEYTANMIVNMED